MNRPIGWTDEELRKAWIGGWKELTVSGAASVFLSTLGAVHPAEAREREREAWDACARYELGGNYERCAGASKDARDERFPSLVPKSPPPLVLSTGEWTRIDGRWYSHDEVGRKVQEIMSCRTASDARKLAEWLEKYGSTEEAK